jgi:hypothetical protein
MFINSKDLFGQEFVEWSGAEVLNEDVNEDGEIHPNQGSLFDNQMTFIF